MVSRLYATTRPLFQQVVALLLNPGFSEEKLGLGAKRATFWVLDASGGLTTGWGEVSAARETGIKEQDP